MPVWQSITSSIVGECKKYKEERDVLEEETREIDEGDKAEFGTLLRGTIVNRTYGIHKNLYI